MPGNYQTELKSWLRKLEILQQENVLLKNKVAEILKHDIDRLTVDRLEHYLACFIEKDAVLALLRKEVADELKVVGYAKAEAEGALEKKMESLQKDIAQMEFEFYKLKTDFSSYVAELTPAA